MKNYNEIKESINNLPRNIKAVSYTVHNFKHSDGGSQTVRHEKYAEPVEFISKSIWNSDISLKEKQELNDYLESKFSI